MGGRRNQVTNKCLGTKFKSYYLLVEGRTKSLTSALVLNLSRPTYGRRTNQVTHKCLGTKFKSYYLLVEGQTKSLTSALVQNLSLPTFGWKDEPSHQRVPW